MRQVSFIMRGLYAPIYWVLCPIMSLFLHLKVIHDKVPLFTASNVNFLLEENFMSVMPNTPIPKIIALTLLVVGAGLLLSAYDMSGSVANQFSSTLTGSYSDRVMYMGIGGAVSLVVGLYLFFKK